MARKLKTYLTSQGFYDAAVAVPSMKAALEAWGAGSNLFHQGFAAQTDDPKIVKATLAKPGVVLRRPVGTNEPFGTHAHLPTGEQLTGHGQHPKPAKKAVKKTAKARPQDKVVARKAAAAFEEQQQKIAAKREREAAAFAKEQKKRDARVARAQAALDKAAADHEARVTAIEEDRATLQARADSEEERWQKLREKLRKALRKAGG